MMMSRITPPTDTGMISARLGLCAVLELSDSDEVVLLESGPGTVCLRRRPFIQKMDVRTD
jgi:hypothetical protein